MHAWHQWYVHHVLPSVSEPCLKYPLQSLPFFADIIFNCAHCIRIYVLIIHLATCISMYIPYTRKFLRYEIFAVHQANRIFAIIFSRTTYYNFLQFSRKLLRCSRFVAYTCFHMAAKIYLTTFSVSKIDWVCLIACHRYILIGIIEY